MLNFLNRKKKKKNDSEFENSNEGAKKRISKNFHKICVNKNPLVISPLLFNKENTFYYEIRLVSFYKKYCSSWNDYKPNNSEIKFLEKLIFEFKERKKNNEKFITVTPYFSLIIQNLKEVPILKNNIDKNIEKIILNHNSENNISLKKIKEKYLEEYENEISITKINRILKNKLNYKFRKIGIKAKDLEKINYKRMGFVFIKILLRALKINLKPIFVDESKFELKNDNFKTWISANDFCHYGPKTNQKRNIILAVGIDELYHYEINLENTNSIIFKNFLIQLFSKIKKEEEKNYILIKDNLASHRTIEVKNILKEYNIKTLLTVPYESSFNPIELAFRYIKNKTYKNIYSDIKKLKNDVEEIIKSSEFRNALSQNFRETLERYMEFINKNNNINLDYE